jgi:phosphoribosylanthranilate isomerase
VKPALAERARDGRLLVKICGITSAGDAALAVEAGADAIGFVFWPRSPRHVSEEHAAAIAREIPEAVLRVGVFVDASAEEMTRLTEAVGLDVLQLHGEEPPSAIAALPRPALKAVRVGDGFSRDEALRYAASAAGILVDTRLPGERGGTGVPFDWSLVKGLAERVPFLMLAGGLAPSNVAEAVRAVRPHAVDVSSGVESAPGRKDAEKVRAFVDAARSAVVLARGTTR